MSGCNFSEQIWDGSSIVLALGTEEDVAFTVRPGVEPQKVLELSGGQSSTRDTDFLTVQLQNCVWFESLEGTVQRRETRVRSRGGLSEWRDPSAPDSRATGATEELLHEEESGSDLGFTRVQGEK